MRDALGARKASTRMVFAKAAVRYPLKHLFTNICSPIPQVQKWVDTFRALGQGGDSPHPSTLSLGSGDDASRRALAILSGA